MSESSQQVTQPAETSPSATGSEFVQWRWALGLLLAAGAAYLSMNFRPLNVNIPPELADVNMYSPPEEQEKLAVAEADVRWKNSLSTLALAGLCLGAIPPLTASCATRRRWLAAIGVGAASGIAVGLALGQWGPALRKLIDTNTRLPAFILDNPIVGDTLVYMAVSLGLSVPIALAYLVAGERQRGQKAGAILLGGLTAGGLAPMASILFPAAATHAFPPQGYALTAVWLGLFAGLVYLLTAGAQSRQKPQTITTPAAE